MVAPIPSLLITSAGHQHLVRQKQRTQVGLIVECGDAREVHHMALLIGYGAGAINPYLAFESIEDMVLADEGRGMHDLGELNSHKAITNYIKAAGKGVLKVMSKMGVSTVASYTGAQIFEAIGLGRDLVDEFSPEPCRLDGIGLEAAEVAARHAVAIHSDPTCERIENLNSVVNISGDVKASTTCSTRKPCIASNMPPALDAMTSSRNTQAVDDQSRVLSTLRGLFEFAGDRQPIPLDEVESVSDIVKRFSTGR